ncbi:MAG TPA: acyl-CoA dehydrogenase family protein, partial [Polyangiaceae bacterium]|nr:acyl-CoA dehydrogenase family protein [Polyangiaceae bacterium]
MTAELSAEQAALRARFRAFTERHVQPHASKADAEGRLPDEVVTELGRAGLLAAMVPEASGGTPLDSVSYGLLHEELGRVCSSTRSLVTVHTMVCAAITRWGVPELRRTWLPKLAAGECVASFALSEPNAGSDAAGIETNVVRSAGGYQIDGTKKWISFGQIA